MKNKKTMSLIGAGVGVCILGTAALANYSTTNGYEALKQTLLYPTDVPNYTMRIEGTMSYDGTELASGTYLLETDADSALEHSKTESTTVDGVNSLSEDWQQDGMNIWYNDYNEGYLGIRNAGDFFASTLLPAVETGDEKTDSKIKTFMSLLADTFVGDLRNNFVCVDDGEDAATYEVNLSSVQIPELVNAGLGAMLSLQNYTYETSEYYQDNELTDTDVMVRSMAEDARVESISAVFTIGHDNMIRNGECSVVFAGEDENGASHSFTVNGKLSVTDIGTTEVQKLDINSVDIEFLDVEPVDTESTEAVG